MSDKDAREQLRPCWGWYSAEAHKNIGVWEYESLDNGGTVLVTDVTTTPDQSKESRWPDLEPRGRLGKLVRRDQCGEGSQYFSVSFFKNRIGGACRFSRTG